MLFVVGVAVGVVWTRFLLLSEQETYEAGFDRLTGLARSIRLARWWARSLSGCILSLTGSWMVIRLRKPRPSIRHLSRQPGFASAVAVITAFATGTIFAVAPWMTGLIQVLGEPRWGRAWWGNVWAAMLSMHPESACTPMVAVWLLLILSGRWRHEPGWIDGMGIALAAYWLLIPPLLIVLAEWMIS